MDFLDFVRKVAQEKREQYIQKGGSGSGWFAPPRGTHGKGSRKKGRGEISLKARASARIAIKRGMLPRDWMDRAQKLFRKPTYSRKQMADAWEAARGKFKGTVSLKLKASATTAQGKGELARDWMDRAQKLFTSPAFTREELATAWEAEKKRMAKE